MKPTSETFLMSYPPQGMEMDFPGTEPAVRVALDNMSGTLSRSGMEADTIGRFEIVMAEALNNVVEHAYASHPSGRISVTLSWDAETVVCILIDEGAELPGHSPPKGRAKPEDCAFEDLPEGGFGWHLIHTIAQNVRYIRSANQNRLSFSIPLEETVETL